MHGLRAHVGSPAAAAAPSRRPSAAAAHALAQRPRACAPGDNEPGFRRRPTPSEKAISCASVPLRKHANQPKEQLVMPLDFPAANVTLNFIIDTVSQDTLISPRARDLLGIGADEGAEVRVGLFHATRGRQVTLPAARIGRADRPHFFTICDAVVVDTERMQFSSAVDGVLALAFLANYDLDIQMNAGKVDVYLQGAVDSGMLNTEGLEEVRCNTLPGGKLGVKMELNGGGVFTGVLDMGSNSSVGNWAAARDLDVSELFLQDASRYPQETGRLRPLFKACFDTVQVGHVLLSNVPDAQTDAQGRLSMYVGYLPEFDLLQEDIRGTRDPARQLALVGLDLLGNTRIVISVKSKRIFFKAKELNDVWAGQVFDSGPQRLRR
ncbi:hypothetical protein JKP88DRAFT_204058 [Tribonema minus]|uniref:Uncharacterized protein n=1 Tax=Tribonema minus TaxID=303371 RepID=A0A835ZPQ0_9STRA|nr:hypothetical protein JKP88DRAFT_204058 [Tribonema minus]